MNLKQSRKVAVRLGFILTAGAASFLLLLAVLIMQRPAGASSHREAPLISKDAFADNTDTYVFISPKNPDNVVLVASFIPFEAPEGGPNYFEWDDNVLYEIHVDNDGDAEADFTYGLRSNTSVQNGSSFLYNTGPIAADGTNWNRQQRYTVTEKTGAITKTVVSNVLAPPVNIGSKSTPGYDVLDDNFIYTRTVGSDEIKVFAGQTDDAFWVDLQVFDLLTLRGQNPPVGYSGPNNIPVDSLSGFNNHSLVIEVPISRLKQGNEPVLGVWATASRRSMRVLNGSGGQTNSGEFVQVSRLGSPLVNEVVIPYDLKDAFNSLRPLDDTPLYLDNSPIGNLLQESVENPEVGRLLCALYGIPLPYDLDNDCNTNRTPNTPLSGRADLFQIFLTGMFLQNDFQIQTANGPMTLPAGTNVNQPAGVVPAEMIRINTDIKGDLCAPTPNRLGVLGGDACGFPNGRRLMDDVVDIELLAVAGAAYQVLDGRDTSFSFDPALIGILDDGLNGNDKPFRSDFPYLAAPHAGDNHFHQNILATYIPVVSQSVQQVSQDVADSPATTAAATMSSLVALGLPLLLWWQRRREID
ncbi:MAG: DUF4331 domain-containing protein [Ardenticatenaceae bacterium]|nr:DUF4331 domain-containing protein [Ardenticatenaceae bacterium]